MRRAVLVLAVLAVMARAAPARAEPPLAFLSVEANEGDSSGGHAALRIGDEVFHFQYHPGRLLRLERDDWPHFRHVYGRLGNRRIHVRRIAATPGTTALLRDAFATRLLEEAARVRFLDALRLDRVLLEAFEIDGGAAAALLPVPGAGYFAAQGPDVEPGLAALRARIVVTEGPSALERRIEAWRAAIRALRYEPRDAEWLVRAESAPLGVPRAFSERLLDALARLRALEVLEGAPPLAPGSFLAPVDATFALDDAERSALARAKSALEARVVELLDSPRGDAGRTLLVALARVAALSRSAESGRLVFLDTFPDDASTIGARRVAERPEVISALREEALAELRGARAGLVWRETPGEAELSALESAANRVHELEAAPRAGRPLRLAPGPMLPARSAPLEAPPLPVIDPEPLASALARARVDEEAFSDRFGSTNGYSLLTRNCVTEIFRSIDAAFAAAGEDPVAASRARLGGHLAADAFPRFIPFVADAAVASTWRVVESRVLASERDVRMADMKEREPALAVELRESNTLTSSLYRLHGDDSFFVFFSDGPFLARPFLGAVNLAAGLGQAALGLATAPFDRGARLSAGASGALFSLPELFFVSLRKGTLDWVPTRSDADEASADAMADAGR